MPRRLLGIWVLLLVSVFVGRAQGDAVLLTINNEVVFRSEFEYYFNKSSEKCIDAFVETYVRFKGKVCSAKELGLDTLSVYRRQKEDCLMRFQQKKQIPKSSKEWIRLLHITYPLKQTADRAEIIRGKQVLDSLRQVLKKNPLQKMEGVEESWTQVRYLLDEWQVCLKSLNRSEWSQPFFSPLGIHLCAWTDCRMSSNCPSDSHLFQKEVEESLLVTYFDDYLSKKIVCSEKELDEWFKMNRENYGAGVPHFYGAVVHCRNKQDAKAIKKFLKKCPERFWENVYERIPDELAGKCRLSVDLFRIGENAYVDKLVFGCGSFEALPDYPYTWVMGKKMKKGPKDFRLVRKKLENDCLKAKKMHEMEALMSKYKVEIDKEVLKTVNRADNK